MKNWMTTLAGIISILTALWHCYSLGKIDVMCIVGVIQGAGLIAAKDRNVTGGTVAQSQEAEVRVEAGPTALAPAAVARVESNIRKNV